MYGDIKWCGVQWTLIQSKLINIFSSSKLVVLNERNNFVVLSFAWTDSPDSCNTLSYVMERDIWADQGSYSRIWHTKETLSGQEYCRTQLNASPWRTTNLCGETWSILYTALNSHSQTDQQLMMKPSSLDLVWRIHTDFKLVNFHLIYILIKNVK